LVVDPSGTHEIHVLASRYGKGVSTYINVAADLGIGKFKELGIANPKQPVATSQSSSSKYSKKSKAKNDDDNNQDDG
jgi:hypothetical protein